MQNYSLKFITGKDIYTEVIEKRIPLTRRFLWIATADIKDMYIKRGSFFFPFLRVLSDLIENNVLVRLIHAKEPGKNFRNDFDKYPNLITGLERILCPRVHFKSVIIDGNFAYIGSANLTGAGMGVKSIAKRNFENGIITDDKKLIDSIMQQFDSLWMGQECKKCGRKEYCIDYKDILL